MKRRLAAVAMLLAACSAGCGVGSAGPVPAGAPASGLQKGSASPYARLYFVGPYGLRAAPREVASPASPQQALDLLLKGPDTAERARGLSTEVPSNLGRLIARAADGAVDLYLPVSVSNMTGGGSLGLSQIICTTANAQVPGGKRPPDVDVRVYEAGYTTAWTVRCDAAGNVSPVPRS
ncbi:hypothetical protein KN815_22745 [Streptomyces sp. 4503]|uniref:Lipoprotein n=1 Tax=Streptomyces niphimycinicus TaxID=2842201 RepID=A0ABS6CIM2_9ACTN|nr:hypothetical protein [Streptomyces niphimycinicus]MBU3866778.1 hypothetical protein [Streptomyces niphimycinicus]